MFYFHDINGELTAFVPESFNVQGYISDGGYELMTKNGHLLYSDEELKAIMKLLNGIKAMNELREMF